MDTNRRYQIMDLLKGCITERQISNITRVICTQYREYLRLMESPQFKSVFSDEYAPHNRQHSVSWAISSAFKSDTNICDNIKVRRLAFGCGHARPLLSNDSIELLILNKTTHFDAKYLKERYQYNSNNFTGEKLFAYIKFSVEQNRLIDVRLCLPNENGIVIAEQVLLDRKAILKFVA